MIKVKKAGGYTASLKKVLIENPQIRTLIEEREVIFIKKPKDSRLSNHALRKRMKGKFAFSITDDIRIIYEWIGKSTVRFLAIGTHHEVYT